jgi:hypothetical protein
MIRREWQYGVISIGTWAFSTVLWSDSANTEQSIWRAFQCTTDPSINTYTKYTDSRLVLPWN